MIRKSFTYSRKKLTVFLLLFPSLSVFVSNFMATDVDIHELRNALEIRSKTEKQIKTIKQSSWLAAALLLVTV